MKRIPLLFGAVLTLSGAASTVDTTPSKRSDRAPQIDPAAVALSKEVDAKVASLKSISATYTTEQLDSSGKLLRKSTASVLLARPNLMRIESTGEVRGSTKTFTVAKLETSDGTYRWSVTPTASSGDWKGRSIGNATTVTAAKFAIPDAKALVPEVVMLGGFFAGDEYYPMYPSQWSTHHVGDPKLKSLKLLAPEVINGTNYQVIEWVYGIGFNLPVDDRTYITKIYIGPDTLVHRVVSSNDKGIRETYILSDIKINTAPNASIFAYTPPAGATVRDQTKASASDRLIPVGAKAPEFSAQDPFGKPVTLASTIAKHKATVFKFWGYS
jgi:outer membrane lipoprotein-sorting protein